MPENAAKPDVGFTFYDTLPADFEAGLVEALKREDLDVRSMRISGGPFAGIESYLPAAAMLFVATAYFTGFIQKAGEDHYELLKQAANKLWKRAAALRITPIGSAGKVSKTPYSIAYAIMGEVSHRHRFKFIVRMDFNEAEAQEGIQAFLDLLRDIHAGTVGKDDLEALMTYKAVGGTTLVTFDPATRRIVPVNAFERT